MGQLEGQNATYRNQLGSLRSENATLQRKASDLARQLSDVQGSPVSFCHASPGIQMEKNHIRDVLESTLHTLLAIQGMPNISIQ